VWNGTRTDSVIRALTAIAAGMARFHLDPAGGSPSLTSGW